MIIGSSAAWAITGREGLRDAQTASCRHEKALASLSRPRWLGGKYREKQHSKDHSMAQTSKSPFLTLAMNPGSLGFWGT